MSSRVLSVGLFFLALTPAAFLMLQAPAAQPTPDEAGHAGVVQRVEIQQGQTLGESQPLVALHPTAADTDADVTPDSASIAITTEEVESEILGHEHSLLVASRIERSANSADDGAIELGISPPLAPQDARQLREVDADEGDDEEDEEEHEEEMPANSVAQGNQRSQPTDEQRMAMPIGAAAVEQTAMGTKAAPQMIASFDGLGAGLQGPQGFSRGGNPSDNSLAVGPNHVVVTVNSQMAVFTKKGERFNETGRVLYGPVNTGNVFKDCGECDTNNGDAVVRYDQLADRWLIVMPIFRRLPARESEPEPGKSGEPAQWSRIGREGQPGPAADLYLPPPLTSAELAAQSEGGGQRRGARGEGRGRGQRAARGQGAGRGRGQGEAAPRGSYAMCYAISTSNDPLGSYYRYHFVRPLFPDYPRPAVWPDGYYVPTSTGDNVIQKHACVVERAAMLKGEPAREQCIIIDGVNFLNNADLDGKELPPEGAPNIMMAAGGSQLNGDLDDDGIYVWKMHVDWNDPARTKAEGPVKIDVAPYNYLCGGQLTRCVPQKGSGTRLDAQGDKIMARLVYRRIGDQESIVGVHSINTAAGGGGVRWYEFRVDDPSGKRDVKLHQQGTYAPGGDFRWMASPAIDKFGNIGIGYSFGGENHFPGQRFAGRQPNDPLGQLTTKEAVLAEGQAAQEGATRWQDYVQTAVDPDDDCTIWYVGDYIKEGNTRYSSRVGAFRLPGCGDE